MDGLEVIPVKMIKTSFGVITSDVNSLPQEEFYWQDQVGQMWHPSEMDTPYLFNCVRMLWNHNVPSDMRLHPYKHYALDGRFRDQQYVNKAISALLKELVNRPDTTIYMCGAIYQMTILANSHLNGD